MWDETCLYVLLQNLPGGVKKTTANRSRNGDLFVLIAMTD